MASDTVEPVIQVMPLEEPTAAPGADSTRSRSTSSPASDTDHVARPASSSATTVPAACLACRAKHLKCDGQKPCRRCKGNNLDCVYVASRRGYKGPRRKYTTDPVTGSSLSPKKVRQRSIASSSSSTTSSSDGNPGHTSIPSVGGPFITTMDFSSMPPAGMPMNASTLNCGILPTDVFAADYPLPAAAAGTLSGSASPHWGTNMMLGGTYEAQTISPPAFSQISYATSASPGLVNQFSQVPRIPQPMADLPSPYHDQCIDAFYDNFYPIHPIGPPKDNLLSPNNSSTDPTSPLVAAIRWAGSRYLEQSPPSCSSSTPDHLGEVAIQQLYSPASVRDGHLVQAMVIAAVCLSEGEYQYQQDTARAVCADAERLALEVGMYSASYAALHGMGDPRLEESWRKTWWELYAVSALVLGCGGGHDDKDSNDKHAAVGSDGFVGYEQGLMVDGFPMLSCEDYKYPPLIT
ncbi:RNA polymerase II-specific transcription factor-like protein [Microdochium nivale]|nr:RNA polymerase II-specific transcription factor-like protein [Microdochium nivale]